MSVYILRLEKSSLTLHYLTNILSFALHVWMKHVSKKVFCTSFVEEIRFCGRDYLKIILRALDVSQNLDGSYDAFIVSRALAES